MPSKRMKSKICLVGENAVGKTSLIKRFVLDIFDDKYLTTIGTKVSKRAASFELEGEHVEVDMLIWDIMGQSTFRALLKDAYFHGAHGIIAVCDSTRPETLPALDEWITEMRAATGEIPVVMLSNKSDLKDSVKITAGSLTKSAKRYECPHFFTSAKTGDHVSEAFEKLAAKAVRRQLESGE